MEEKGDRGAGGDSVGFKSRTRRTGLLLREMRLIFFPRFFSFFQPPRLEPSFFVAHAPLRPSPGPTLRPPFSSCRDARRCPGDLDRPKMLDPRFPSPVTVSCHVGGYLSIITRSRSTQEEGASWKK